MRKHTTEAESMIRTVANGSVPRTIEETLAHNILGMEASELRQLARRAHQRGFTSVLPLIQAEFRRRRASEESGVLSSAAA